ncbi:MAG: hypothetical protein EXQ85_05685 [Alphaproteobacteria bacterium]|nr:hypothetical protein [Alphaproteobacteria bacterium]
MRQRGLGVLLYALATTVVLGGVSDADAKTKRSHNTTREFQREHPCPSAKDPSGQIEENAMVHDVTNEAAKVGAAGGFVPPGAVVLQAAGAESLTIPFGAMLLKADFSRSGSDLHLEGPSGEEVIVREYFAQAIAPVLVTAGGARLMPQVVEALAGPDPDAPNDETTVASNADVTTSGDDQLIGQSGQPIGTVDTAEGGVFAVRADGARVALHAGDPIFKSDVLETNETGAVNVKFADDSQFSLDQGSRMTVDDLTFNPSSGEGKSSFTVVQGVFTFVSGQIAKTGSDAMQVHTPVATIGILGTKVAIRAGAEGEDTVISLLKEESGHTGEIAVTNQAGTQILNIANQTVFMDSQHSAPSQPTILPSEQLRAIYSGGSNPSVGVGPGAPKAGGERRGGQQQGRLEEAVDKEKEAAKKEGHSEKKVQNAEAAAEVAFELALAEGKDEKKASEEAAKTFKDAITEDKGADQIIATAAGNDPSNAPGATGGSPSDAPDPEQIALAYQADAGQNGDKLKYDSNANTLSYHDHNAPAGQGYQTVATVDGQDVKATDIEII